MTTPIAQGPCGLPGSAALDDDDEAAFAEDEKARIAALHKTAPEVIWLQIDDEAEQFQGWDAQTWCEDKINETDVKYVRADLTPNVEVTGAARLYRAASSDRRERGRLPG
jgi:hypothetical protein